MSKPIGDKEAGNRAMREARYTSAKIDIPRAADLRATIAAVPVKRVPKKKRL